MEFLTSTAKHMQKVSSKLTELQNEVRNGFMGDVDVIDRTKLLTIVSNEGIETVIKSSNSVREGRQFHPNDILRLHISYKTFGSNAIKIEKLVNEFKELKEYEPSKTKRRYMGLEE